MRTSHKTPRREVRWKLDKSAYNGSLESIVRRFEDYLDCVSASPAHSPLRRITASTHGWVSHRCPGYLREEITLTADVSRSVVIAHQYPSRSEICTICGQLVRSSKYRDFLIASPRTGDRNTSLNVPHTTAPTRAFTISRPVSQHQNSIPSTPSHPHKMHLAQLIQNKVMQMQMRQLEMMRRIQVLF